MSDLAAVSWWCLVHILAAVPAVAAYYFGRWAQRRDDRATKEGTAMSVVLLAAVCVAAALLGAWLVPRQICRERQRTFAPMTRAMNEFAAAVGQLVPSVKAASAAFQQFALRMAPFTETPRDPQKEEQQ